MTIPTKSFFFFFFAKAKQSITKKRKNRESPQHIGSIQEETQPIKKRRASRKPTTPKYKLREYIKEF